MKNKILRLNFFILLFFIFKTFCFSKESFITPYLELGGQSLGISVNLEYRISNFAVRGGFTFLGLGAGYLGSLSYVTNKDSSHHVELGLGGAHVAIASIFGGGTSEKFLLSAFIGYRFQPKNGGFLFRVGFTPLFWTTEEEKIDINNPRVEKKIVINIKPWAGISLGYSF